MKPHTTQETLVGLCYLFGVIVVLIAGDYGSFFIMTMLLFLNTK